MISLRLIDFDGEWQDDDFVRNLAFPWHNIPQYRVLTGRSPLPTYSEESMAASGLWTYASWQLGISARSVATQFMVHRQYVMPIQTKALIATAPITLAYANKKIIERAPVEQQPSLWRVFAQGLTGTGPGVGGWSPY